MRRRLPLSRPGRGGGAQEARNKTCRTGDAPNEALPRPGEGEMDLMRRGERDVCQKKDVPKEICTE